MEQTNLPLPESPRTFRWKTLVAGLLILSGLLFIGAVLIRVVPEFGAPQGTQLGLLLIWIGVLLFQKGKTYFSVISSLTLLLSLLGFADNLIYDVTQPSNFDPKFVVHGVFCLAWMIAFAVQADLVRTGRWRLHQRLGWVGYLVAFGFTISTIYVFYAIWKPWDEMPMRAQLNRILLPGFVVLLVLSWVLRDKPATHKRLILMGTLYLMQPMIARAVAGFFPAFVIIWSGLFVSLFVYDWRVQKRIHPVTVFGTIGLLLTIIGVVLT